MDSKYQIYIFPLSMKILLMIKIGLGWKFDVDGHGYLF